MPIWPTATSSTGPTLPLKDIIRDMVEARHLAIAKQVEDKHLRFSGKASANGAMRVLRAVYNYALDKTDELPPNPVRLKRQWNKIAPTRAGGQRRRHAGVLSSGDAICRRRLVATIYCWSCSPA